MRSHAGMAKQTRGRRLRFTHESALVRPLVGWLVGWLGREAEQFNRNLPKSLREVPQFMSDHTTSKPSRR
jgi:hypothetical protein